MSKQSGVRSTAGHLFGRLTLRIATVTAGLHLVSANALAQMNESRLAKEDSSGSLPFLIAAGIAVVVCLSGFLNPKRSHLTRR